MDKIVRISLLAVLLTLLVLTLLGARGKTRNQMRLTSPAFSDGKAIPGSFSCEGSEVSPPLEIHGVPGGTKSLALIMDDPDAPGGVWVHWVLWNLDPAATKLAQGAIPPGAVEGVNSWGRKGYGGPCPPSGTHRYYFRLYALTKRLDLPPSTTRAELDKAMRGKMLADCELYGTYSRQK